MVTLVLMALSLSLTLSKTYVQFIRLHSCISVCTLITSCWTVFSATVTMAFGASVANFSISISWTYMTSTLCTHGCSKLLLLWVHTPGLQSRMCAHSGHAHYPTCNNYFLEMIRKWCKGTPTGIPDGILTNSDRAPNGRWLYAAGVDLHPRFACEG